MRRLSITALCALSALCACSDPPPAETITLTFELADSVPAADVDAIELLAIELTQQGRVFDIEHSVEPGAFGDRRVEVRLANGGGWNDLDVSAEARATRGLIALGQARVLVGDGDATITLFAPDGDAGSPDAGSPDAGPSDAGPSDAGSPDAGPSDAGPSDAGMDAGGCAADGVVVTGEDEGVFLRSGADVRVIGGNRCGVLGRPETPVGEPVGFAGSWLQISAGGSHSCGIQSGGGLYCWGLNAWGEVGTGVGLGMVSAPTIVTATGVFGWRSVAAGTLFTCATSDEDALYCWGLNDRQRLGSPFAVAGMNQTEPFAVPTMSLDSVTASPDHACALGAFGNAYCWGDNTCGKAGGGGTAETVDLPTMVPGGTTFSRIEAGFLATCGIAMGDGGLYCFGAMSASGERCDAAATNCHCSINTTPTRIDGGPFMDLALTSGGGCAITMMGELACWGTNVYGELANGETDPNTIPRGLTIVGDLLPEGVTFTTVTAGSDGFCATTSDRRVYCWGRSHLPTSPRCFDSRMRHYEVVPTPRELCR